MARLAEHEEEIAYSAHASSGDSEHLLEAFRYYAAAAQQARREDWPDDAWKSWRYQRASLARRLAHDGLMKQVAAMYDGVMAKKDRISNLLKPLKF
ncbi:MAG: hypothetical protein KGJ72_09085 [Gammaproteobacteria bacterium]|nr:hypothetical protein [Gammaproteobacteria bacterium]